MVITFTQQGDFAACRAAERWCEERGVSVGHMERGRMRGLLCGKFDIQKWHNLNQAERDALHGTMSGDMRNGPVQISLDDSALAVRELLKKVAA
jgi:hypothetical protein